MTKFHTRSITLGVLINIFAILIFVMPGCSSADSDSNTEDDDKLAGSVEVDGSSTVYPVSEAVAEEFNKLYPNVRVNVGVSGSGGGFKRFVNGETDISDASRPIRENEAAEAEENGIDYIELRIGTDGLSVIVNNDNDFVDCLTTDELKQIWEPGSEIDNWSQVRKGTMDSINNERLNIMSSLEIRTTTDNSSSLITGHNSDWHQGCAFFVLKK